MRRRSNCLQSKKMPSAQESREHSQTILDHINEYIYSVEYYMGLIRSIYHSPQCQSITGYSPVEYYRDDKLWLSMIHKDDRAMIIEFLRDIWSDQKRMPIEHRIIHKDGTEHWVLNYCVARRDKIAMNFIREHSDAVAQAQLAQALQFRAGKDPSGGVLRVA